MVTSLHRGARPSSAPIIPMDPNFPRGNPLGVLAYGVWAPVVQAPARGLPTIVGCLPPPLPHGRIVPSPHGHNSCPSLPMIPISPLLCARPRGDGAGRSTASTPSPVPSPVVPSGVIPSVRIYLIVLSSLLFSRSKSQRFVPSTTNCPPPIKKSASLVASHAPFEKTDKAHLP